MSSRLCRVWFLIVLPVAAPPAVGQTFTVDMVRTDSADRVVSRGSFTYQIIGELSDGDGNLGLAFFAYDLTMTGPVGNINLGLAVEQHAGPSATSFERPNGYSIDFNGTPVGDDLLNCGGGQNTVGHACGGDPDDFPCGVVVLDIGHGPVILHEGTVTFPAGATDGEYVFSIIPGSLAASVITADAGTYFEVDEVDDVSIGTEITVEFGFEGEPPELVHARAGETGPVTFPCSGYIDPRRETSNGVDLDEGLQQTTLVFTRQIRDRTGTGDDTELSPESFIVNETGDGDPPEVIEIVAAETYVDPDTGRHVVAVRLSGPITVQEWTTIIADVEDLVGNPIVSEGDLGNDDEPDRVDYGFLPCDVNQSGNVSPLDRIRMRMVRLGPCSACRSLVCGPDFAAAMLNSFDFDRSGASSPIDLVRYTQAYLGTNEARWNGAALNNRRP